MASLPVFFSVSTEGETVAEALIADQDQGAELLAAAREASSQLAWAHSAADLSALGFVRQHGYRKMTGPASGRSGGAGQRAGRRGRVLGRRSRAHGGM